MSRDPLPRSRAAGPARLPVLLGALLLGGCAMMPGQAGRPAATAALPLAPQDPIAVFAASAAPGAAATVRVGGGATPVRMLRSYHAASGRECREVLVGADAAARTQLICYAEAGGWTPVRPLLRGGGTPRS